MGYSLIFACIFGKTRKKQKKGPDIMVRPASLPCTANHISFTFPTQKVNIAGKVHGNISRKSVAQQAFVISSCDNSFSEEESPAADRFTIIYPTTLEADLCESYRRELDRKEAEIQHLNRQLESSSKLMKFYKCKSERRVWLSRRKTMTGSMSQSNDLN